MPLFKQQRVLSSRARLLWHQHQQQQQQQQHRRHHALASLLTSAPALQSAASATPAHSALLATGPIPCSGSSSAALRRSTVHGANTNRTTAAAASVSRVPHTARLYSTTGNVSSASALSAGASSAVPASHQSRFSSSCSTSPTLAHDSASTSAVENSSIGNGTHASAGSVGSIARPISASTSASASAAPIAAPASPAALSSEHSSGPVSPAAATIKDHRLTAFESNHVAFEPTNASDMPALDSICSSPYFVPRSVTRTLRLFGHAHVSLDHGSRHLALAAPHPGSSLLMEQAVRAMATDIGADLQMLDYQTFLSAATELGSRKVAWKSTDRLGRFEKPHLLAVSESFSPAKFDIAMIDELEEDADDDAEFDEEAGDEDADEDEADHRGSSKGSSLTKWMQRNGVEAVDSQHHQHHHHHHIHHVDAEALNKVSQPLVFKVNIVQDGTAATGDSPHADAKTAPLAGADAAATPAIRVTNVSIQPELPVPVMRAAEQSVAAMIASQDNVSASARKPKTEETHYDTRLTDSQIRSVLGSLRNSILSRLDTASADAAGDTTGQRKLVLFVRDATDMLETDSVDGRKIIVGLMDLVRMLRQDYRVPVLLVAGCSPSLANTGNLEKDASFYATLFDGSGTLVNTNDGYAHQNIWVDGKLFETPLDSLTDEFEKIDLLPPSPVGAYLDQMLPSETSVSAQSTNTNGAAASGIDVSRSGRNARSNTRVASSCSPSAASAATAATTAATAKTSDQAAASTLTPVHGSTFSDLVEGLDQITLHIEALQRDLRLRLREINWRNFEAACSRRGVQLRGLDAMQIANPTEALMDHIQFPPDFQLLLGMLEVGVWPTLRINRLVTLAMACRMELSLRNGVAPPATLDVSAQQLLEALRVMYQLDLVRLSRNNAIQSLEEGDEGEITPATVSFSSSTSTSSRVASSASSATPTAGSTAASTSASVSTVPRVASAAGGSASGFTGSSATAANAASDASTLQDMLRRDGHRINSYEKKLLSTVVNPDNIKVSFSDLVLPAPTKLMLQTLVTLPMLRPEYFTTGILSRSAIHGVLLFGPPGTGKTMLAKAVAKSSGARFMSVALSDVFDKYVGEGEKNVRAVFTLARRIAPCVVFLDEVDAIFGSRRNDSTSSSRREIMNEFMAEWDGLNSNNNGVIVLGATNRPFDLDDAILRRMPRRVLVDLPNEQARANIIKLLLRDEPTDASVVIQSLAQRTHLYSGSDLKNLCVAAALARVKETIVRDLLRTETGVDADSLSTEAVMSRLEHLDDWSACLEPAKSHGRSQTLSASHASKHASTATPVAASTHGRRQRSSSASASALSTQTQLISASARSMATTEAVTVASPPSWSTSSHASSRAPSEPEALQAMASTSDASETSSSSQPAATTPISGSPLKPLTLAHFEVAFAEVPPSLTDEMATLVELRKWDEMYGDGAARRKNKKRHGWGFDAALPASSSPVSPASPATAVLAEQTQPSASASGQ